MRRPLVLALASPTDATRATQPITAELLRRGYSG